MRGAIFVTFDLRAQPSSFKSRVIVIYSLFDALSARFDREMRPPEHFKPCTWRVKDADTQSHDIINGA